MSQAPVSPPFRTTVVLGALLWTAVAFSVGYLVGAQRQFSRLPLVHIGQEVAFDSKAVTFTGWSNAENDFRWSDGKRTKIVFRPEKLDPNRPGDLRLDLRLAHTLDHQPVTIALNGQKLSSFVTTGGPAHHTFVVPRALLQPLGDNALDVEHPQARQPGTADPRRLAIALRNWRLLYDE